MNPRRKYPVVRDPEGGGVLVVVAISLVVLLAFVALVVDLGWGYVNRNQLQNVADAASLAATRDLGHMYQQLDPADQEGFTCRGTCQTEIRAVANAVAEKNWAGGVSISLRPEDIRIGVWDGDVFTEEDSLPDAVEVTSRRDENINTPIPTFFARVLGIEDMSVVAIATAAMTGQGSSGPGDLLFPVTLSSYFFENQPGGVRRCNDKIVFHPSNDPASCGGWTTWDNKSNANILGKILDEKVESPPIVVGDDETERIWTTGGDVASAFSNMIDLFKRNGCASTTGEPAHTRVPLTNGAETCITSERAVRYFNGELGSCCDNGTLTRYTEEGVEMFWPDPQPPNHPDPEAPRFLHVWRTGVPVYDYAEGGGDQCSNPSARTMWKVVGFAPVVITDVIDAPEKTIVGYVECNQVSNEDNRGGGGDFGIKGPIPGLVR